MAVKTGEIPLTDVLTAAADLRARAVRALESRRTPLPADPDAARVSAWMVDAHQRHWAST
jgi:hypothetical protein